MIQQNQNKPDEQKQMGSRATQKPFFNAPKIVLIFCALFLSLHLLRQFLSPQIDLQLILHTAFIPALYGWALSAFDAASQPIPWMDFWVLLTSPFTYSFLHGDFEHVLMNSLWFLVFGAPVAWRFGSWRFLILCVLTSFGGALAHGFTHQGSMMPLVGASGIVSGLTAAALRFIFEPESPIFSRGAEQVARYHQPAPSLRANFKNPQVFGFVMLWLIINFIFGYDVVAWKAEENIEIAWQAHLGGFVAGFFAFAWA